jgi:sugar O-acyltransferase (sialic acid O-acetyltransferase NeuD family)
MRSDLCTPRPPENRLAIFGAGGHAREVAWLAQECWGEGLTLTFLIDQATPSEAELNGVAVMQLQEYADRYVGSPIAVAIGDPVLREQCVSKCAAAGFAFVSLVHPRVDVSPWVTIGAGTVVCAGSVLTTNLTIGQHVHINVGCTVSHDANIGDFSTLSPGVHLAGWVTLGRRVFLGTGAVIRNGASGRPITIGDDVIIGAGACVIGDLEKGVRVAGVPARPV